MHLYVRRVYKLRYVNLWHIIRQSWRISCVGSLVKHPDINYAFRRKPVHKT